MKIVKIDRGSVEIEVDGKILLIYGEAMMPQTRPELTEFVVYINTLKWKSEPNTLSINKEQILHFLKKEFLERSMKLLVE